MIIAKEKIEEYIPQRPPFIMVDNLIEASADLFKTDFRIEAGNLFLDNGRLREFGLIENIAQSASAGLAFTRKYGSLNKPEGYLGGVSKLKLYELPRVNDTIRTEVHLLAQLENLFLVKGINYLDGRMLMECQMKLAGAGSE